MFAALKKSEATMSAAEEKKAPTGQTADAKAAPEAKAPGAAAEEEIDIDLTDPGVQDAAAKIQNVFRKKKS